MLLVQQSTLKQVTTEGIMVRLLMVFFGLAQVAWAPTSLGKGNILDYISRGGLVQKGEGVLG